VKACWACRDGGIAGRNDIDIVWRNDSIDTDYLFQRDTGMTVALKSLSEEQTAKLSDRYSKEFLPNVTFFLGKKNEPVSVLFAQTETRLAQLNRKALLINGSPNKSSNRFNLRLEVSLMLAEYDFNTATQGPFREQRQCVFFKTDE